MERTSQIRAMRIRTMRIRTMLVAGAVALAACGGDGSAAPTTEVAAPPSTTSTSTTPTTPTSATTTTVPTTTTTAAPTTTTQAPGPVGFQPLADGAIVVEATRRFINPGAIIRHAGGWHMFTNDFASWPGVVKVRHYRSDDGLTWEEATGTLFTSESTVFDTPLIVLGGYVGADGTWTLYFHTFNGLTAPSIIGRATAEAADGPWTVHEQPVLEPGEPGAWDDLQVTRPSVVVMDDEIWMYYLGTPSEGDAAIGLATSEDGVSFTKHPEPVLQRAGWEESLERPDVVRTTDGLVMIYRGTIDGPMGLATSADGLEWSRVSDAPSLVEGRELERSFWQGELTWTEADGLRFYLEAGSGRGTDVYLWAITLP